MIKKPSDSDWAMTVEYHRLKSEREAQAKAFEPAYYAACKREDVLIQRLTAAYNESEARGKLIDQLREDLIDWKDHAESIKEHSDFRPCACKRYAEIIQSYEAELRTIDIVFDNEPMHKGPRFIEVEEAGKSIRLGEWVKREDGYTVLRFRAQLEKP